LTLQVSSAMIFDVLLSNLEKELRDGSGAAIAAFVAKARTQLEGTLGAVEIERTKGLAEVAKEKDDLQREIAAMQKQQEAQHGRIVLGIGGYRYTTSVQTLRRLPGTFFDAYFSGRYTMDRSEDGSIFIDRDGKHFGQVLEYLRRGVVSAAEREASELDVGELRWLQREFGFYCIELFAEPQDVAFVVGGAGVVGSTLASVERYDAVSGAWREAASMTTARAQFGLCKLSDGDIYATGGVTSGDVALASVECYDSSLNIWSAAPSLPRPRWAHYACAVGNTMYIIGGIEEDGEGGDETVNSVLKFDCRMQTWSEGPPLPEGRFNPGACVSGCNIYIFGGRTENYGTASTSFRFNTETNEWATLAPMPEANSLHSTSILDALIYVMGGSDSDGNTNSAVHRFDPVANLWSTVAPMSIARSMLGSFVTGGSIYAVGGSDGENTWLSSMERYSVGSDSWSEVPGGEMGTARDLLRTLVVRLEVDLFESLIAKAKIEGL
jgi:N-acetylneuraminic acid mutarotase